MLLSKPVRFYAQVSRFSVQKPRANRALRAVALSLAALLSCARAATAQTNVVTQRYDISRSGANTNETILTTSNVNATPFGKLFSQTVDGQIYAQPLYLPGISIPSKGSHNVIFVATEHDS